MKKTRLRTVSQKTAARNRLYRSLLDLRGKTCASCLSAKATQRHHVYELEDCPWMATDAWNLEPLCKSCHDTIHNDCAEEEYREMLRQHEPARMLYLDNLKDTGGKVNKLRRLG